MTAEKRAGARVAVDLPVRYVGEDGKEHAAFADNISTGGMMLIGDDMLPVGSQIRIAFEDRNGQRHEVVGEIVRSTPMGQAGIAFVHVEESTMDYVYELLGSA